MDLKSIKIVYFIGVGGIGMSVIVCYFNGRGVKVFGYDKILIELIRMLVVEGIDIYYEEDVFWILKDVDLVVYILVVFDMYVEL